MTQQQAAPPDPFTLWRDWVAQSERQWNAFLNQAMASEEFSKTLGQFMDVYLNMQKTMNEVMGRYFSALNLPTRTDVLGLGDRLAAIEEQLTELREELRRGAPTAITSKTPADRPRPPRTKKPAKQA